MNIFLQKIKDTSFAVAPVLLIVLLLHFTISPLETPLLIRFIIGSLFIVSGLSLFLIGVDLAITPLGNRTGSALAKSNKLWLVVAAGLILGFFISIAEPGLLVLSDQVDMVTSGAIPSLSLLAVVSIGLAFMLALGFIRIFYNISLNIMLFLSYLLIFALALFTSPEFMGIAFDASGATTGILAVPFILALAVGISSLKKGAEASATDSFGLVAIASAGAIISVMLLNILSPAREYAADIEISTEVSYSIWGTFVDLLPGLIKDNLLILSPLLAIFILLQIFHFKLSPKAFRRMVMGFIYAFIGLIIFFLGVNGGFMDVGIQLGYTLTRMDNKLWVVVISFLVGLVTILAEPAVYVQTHQIEDITSGYVKRVAVLVPLCLGVGVSVALSVVRILIPSIQLWHYLLPGYIIALGLMFFAPKLFVGIAFDAGGVATGPMTATFILAFIEGVAAATETANILIDAFGMISMVALSPILTLQVLGLVFKLRARKDSIKMEGNENDG